MDIKNRYLNEVYLISSMADAKHEAKLKIYRENFNLLHHYQIIYVEEKIGKDNIKPMTDILSIDKKYIFSPFHSDRLFVINERFILGNPFVRYFYDILLDTQIVSYIYRKDKESNELIKNIVSKLGRNRKVKSSASISLYLTENCLFSENISDKVYENIWSFFEYMYRAHTKYKWLAIRKTKKAVKKIIKNQDAMFNNPFNDKMKEQYQNIYILLMKICIISIEKKSTKEKTIELMNFQNEYLKAIDIGITELAIAYFRLKHKISFFGKIQKGRDDLLITSKNMAWDLFHLRHQNFSTSFQHVKNADVTLSLLCSVDRRLLEIRKFMKLKMLAFDKRNLNFFPFYENQELKGLLSKDEIHYYFSADEHFRRLEQKTEIDLNRLKEKVENELLSKFK